MDNHALQVTALLRDVPVCTATGCHRLQGMHSARMAARQLHCGLPSLQPARTRT